jgi:urocanate hydratase
MQLSYCTQQNSDKEGDITNNILILRKLYDIGAVISKNETVSSLDSSNLISDLFSSISKIEIKFFQFFF